MRLTPFAAVATVLLVASAGTAYAVGALGVPSVVGVENHVVAVDEDETVVRTDLAIENPNPIGMDARDLEVTYAVTAENVTMATGRERGLSVRPGRQTLSVRTAMRNDRIPAWWVAHVGNGERSTLRVTAAARARAVEWDVGSRSVERPIRTRITDSINDSTTRTVDADLLLISDPVLFINETSARWGSVTDDESPLETRLTVYNPKPVAYAVTAIGYDVTMNDVKVGTGRIDRRYVLEPRSTATVNATTVIENDRLDDWWVTHLENDETTTLRIHYYAVFDLPTGHEIRVPFEEADTEATFRTEIFDGTPRTTPTNGTEARPPPAVLS